jgi:bifunctional aspartokinase / homoserine dehydrogenase 1
MQVLKFGGSSLANASAVRHVASLIRDHAHNQERDQQTVVVCSACAGVTNRLAHLAAFVREGRQDQALFEAWAIRSHHNAILAALNLPPASELSPATDDGPARVETELDELAARLRSHVVGTSASDAGAAWTDTILSYGERVSVRLVAAALRQQGARAAAIDATLFLVTDDRFQNASPLWDETRVRAPRALAPCLGEGVIPVVTGFIGATLDGRITTLGRNSSDFSAAILANVLDADEISIWTDVDGIYGRNSHHLNGNDEFTLLEELSYDEALDLARRGAKILHAGAIEPLKEKEIALRIRNTFHPERAGTRIGPAVRTLAR